MEKLSIKLIVGTWLLTALLAIPGISISQTSNQKPVDQRDSMAAIVAPRTITLVALGKIRGEAESSTDLSETDKKTVLGLLDRAINLNQSESQLRKDIESIKQRVQETPARIKQIEAELNRSLEPPEQVATTASNMKPDQRENQLRKLETELSDASTILNRFTDQLTALKDRPAGLQQEMAAARQRLLELTDELKATPSPDEAALLVRARQVAGLVEQLKIQTELELFQNQLVNHDTFTARLTAERDLAAREAARLGVLTKGWQAQVQRLREFEAKKERVVAEQSKKLAVDLPPVIQKQYDITIKLGKMLEKFTADEAQILAKLELKQDQLKQLAEDFAMAREQVEYPLYSETIGLALREQRRTLPDIEKFRQDSAQRRLQMGEIRAILMDIDRQRRELTDLDKVVDLILQKEPDLKATDLDLLKTELRRLLGERREIVKKLQAGLQRSFKNIQRLEFIEQQIATKAQEEALFLDEHLLWIRSAKTIGSQDLKNLLPALMWLFSPSHWWQAAQNLMLSVMGHPIVWIPGLLIPIICVCLRRWVHRGLSRVAQNVYSVKTDSFVLTLQAMAFTFRASFGWPLLLGFTGWQLARMSPPQDFALAAGNGLISAALTLAGSLFFYEMCWKAGVVKVHFKWPESVRRALQRSLRWFIPILVCMTFIFTAVQTRNHAVFTDSLGRLALTILMLSLAGWAAYVLRFSGEVVSMLKHRKQDGWLVRLRFVWYPLAIGVPLLLIVLAAMGYYYSVYALYIRIGETIAFFLGLIIVQDLVLRWFSIIQRRLMFEKIKRKKDVSDQKQAHETMSGTAEAETVGIEEPEINLAQIYEKNQILLRTITFFTALVGLWLVWSNVLPALSFLENVTLWTYSVDVEGARAAMPVTLADLMIAIIVTIVTIVAAKNLPGLLEIILLNRFSMDYGARHAFITIFSYAITALGVVIAFATIGLKWSNLQWLVAALSVGLGFGLQEVVANFICGLIVLFERPFRIGDTVTVADISGTVTRIQIRATTILDWDRKELIVPNKEFITGRLVNWSLSDNVIRIKIPVGIAYGSDTELAEKLLFNAAKANPLVIDNPEPRAVFLGFGDHSLNFELRVYINDLNNWIPLLHKLNLTIDREFRKAGVTISFPQRDVHLDQVGPLEVRVVPDRQSSSVPASAVDSPAD
jgi:potassium efflux system protein